MAHQDGRSDFGLRPSPQVVSRSFGDVAILISLETDRVYELNATGTRFWELLGDGADHADIRGAMAEEFDVEPGELDSALRDLVAALTAEGLIQIHGK